MGFGRYSVCFSYTPDKLLSYQYDRYGNRSMLTLDDGLASQHDYIYDKRNHLTNVIFPGSQAFVLTYTEADERDTIAYPNEVTTTYTYTLNGPIDTISTKTSADVSLELWDYSYNAVLNIDDITTNDGLTDYTYDDLDRLTGAVYPEASPLTDESYEYDRVGNREDPNDANVYGYDGNNQITTSPGLTYGFDADGNMINRSDGAIFTYDATNRLRTFVGTDTGDYQYEPAGRRISKVVNGSTTTWFLWDGISLLAEYDGAGNRAKRYAYLSNEYSPIQMEDTNGIYSVHYDHLQAPKLVTNGSEVVVWSNRMMAFGQSLVNDDPDNDTSVISMNIRFPGQYTDTESLLSYNLKRWYDPKTGIYLSRDPIPIESMQNGYSYVYGNPILLIDPTGGKGRRSTQTPPPGNYNPYVPRNARPWNGGRRNPRLNLGEMGTGNPLKPGLGDLAQDIIDQINANIDSNCAARLISFLHVDLPKYKAWLKTNMQPCETRNCNVCLTIGLGCLSRAPIYRCKQAPNLPGNYFGQNCTSFSVTKREDKNQCLDCGN